MGLYLGTWYGTRLDQTFYWLRWWSADHQLLYWGTEKAAQERLLREVETQRAEAEKQRAEAEAERANAEKQRADLAEQEIARLKQLLGMETTE